MFCIPYRSRNLDQLRYIPDVVYFVERHPPGIFINLTQLSSCSGSKLDVRALKEAIDIYFGGQQRVRIPE